MFLNANLKHTHISKSKTIKQRARIRLLKYSRLGFNGRGARAHTSLHRVWRNGRERYVRDDEAATAAQHLAGVDVVVTERGGVRRWLAEELPVADYERWLDPLQVT